VAVVFAARDERQAGEQEGGAEGEEPEVPSDRAAEVIAHVVRPVEPQLSGGIPSRGSLLAALQRGLLAHPDLAAPWRLMRHAGLAVKRGAALSRLIVHPVPECLPPAHSLHTQPPVRAGQALL
jgi:hypothetical protein